MIHLCFAGGLRVSELVGVLLENVVFGTTPSVTIRGKRRKERCLPLWREIARNLRAWLSVRCAMRTPELSVNAEGAAVTHAGFDYVLDKHVRAAAEVFPTIKGNQPPDRISGECTWRFVIRATIERHPIDGRGPSLC